MNKIIYSGPFASQLHDHIALKQAIGYKYETDARHLLRFDRFTAEKYPDATALSKEIVMEWCAKKSYESQANQCSRTSIIRQFAIYLETTGQQAYVMPKSYYPSKTQYVPHIYTEDELRCFFAQTDQCHYVSECPHRHFIMPVYFRMLYTCGLRLSEARLLTVGDVNLKSGILTIAHSKKDNSRLVPMSQSITERCKEYFTKVHTNPSDSNYFFPGLDGKPMTLQNIYHNFRHFLWKAGISHAGRGKGPRVHDFRHSYACHCLKKWVLQGKDLQVYLPVLKTYMGHDSFHETAYYLRLTADIYPDISIKIEGCYPDIIPSIGGDTDD